MRYISSLFIVFLSIWATHAGLFEYTMWESTRINTTTYESADIVESLDIRAISPAYYNNDRYNYSNYNNTHRATNTSYNRYNTSYNNTDITKQMQYYISIANGLRNDISKIRKYGWNYLPLRKQLQADLADIEDEIKYLSELRSDITRSNRYYYTSSHYNPYFRSQRLVNYYRKYGYEYDIYAGSYYHYDRNYWYYQRKPEWLNENLRPRDEWYIYIQ